MHDLTLRQKIILAVVFLLIPAGVLAGAAAYYFTRSTDLARMAPGDAQLVFQIDNSLAFVASAAENKMLTANKPNMRADFEREMATDFRLDPAQLIEFLDGPSLVCVTNVTANHALAIMEIGDEDDFRKVLDKRVADKEIVTTSRPSGWTEWNSNDPTQPTIWTKDNLVVLSRNDDAIAKVERVEEGKDKSLAENEEYIALRRAVDDPACLIISSSLCSQARSMYAMLGAGQLGGMQNAVDEIQAISIGITVNKENVLINGFVKGGRDKLSDAFASAKSMIETKLTEGNKARMKMETGLEKGGLAVHVTLEPK
ncbi:MAG: hypothetical protein AAB229_08485 [Candidatus Hydrogenedentota bacterium]